MRILYLHQYYCPIGGSGNTRSRDFARFWTMEGHSVTVVTSFAQFPSAMYEDISAGGSKEFLFDRVSVHAIHIPYSHMDGFRRRVRSFLQFFLSANKYISRELKAGDFDIIYASSTPPTVGEMGRKLAAKWKIPFVFETVDVWPDVPIGMGVLRNRLLSSWITRRVNRIYQSAAHIICLSEGMAEQVLSHGNWVGKTTVIHNGTDFQQYAGIGHTAQRETTHFVYAGTIGKANGLDHLVRAIGILEGRGVQKFKVTVLGDGNDAVRVRALAKQLKLQTVQFSATIPKEEMGAFLSEADIGIVCFANYPVLEANSANKFYDYLAAGLPVVLNYQGWQDGYLKQFGCGWGCEQGDDALFAEALQRFIETPETDLQKMGEKARILARTHFDRKELANKVLAIFKKIMASHS